MKLAIECPPEVFEILSNHYNHITPADERPGYTFDEYMTDLLTEEAERIKEEYKQDDNSTDTD